MRTLSAIPVAFTIALSLSIHAGPTAAPQVDGWRAVNRTISTVDEGGRQILRVDAQQAEGIVWKEGVEFRDGTIELDLRGANRPQQSFVGVAFRGMDDRTFDSVYFRPFNFRAEMPGRQRAVQYMSLPDHPWPRLRKEHPGKYEGAVMPAPDPDGWFHARIVVEGRAVRVFVDHATEPSL